MSIVRGAAALMLWPPNLDRQAALRVLVETVAGGERGTEDGPPIGPSGWRQWLDGEAGRELRDHYADGFHDSPLVTQVSLLGLRRGLLGGDLEFPETHYRLWTAALAGLLDEGQDPWLRQALNLLDGSARICDRVVREAGLGIHRWPDHDRERGLAVPGEEDYERLCEALAIPADRLREQLGLDARVVGSLIRDGRSASTWRPLLRLAGGDLLLADPWRLTLAGLVRAAATAAASPRSAALAERLAAAALDIAAAAAGDMGWEVEAREESRLLAAADVDRRVLCGVYVLPPQEQAEPPREGSAAGSFRESWERLRRRAADLGARHSLLVCVGDGRPLIFDRDHRFLESSEPAAPWVVGVGELRLIGDALRGDPLALPAALEQSRRPPWPENFDLADFVGFSRQAEAPFEQRPDPPIDGTELLWLLARQMAMRHPAPRADAAGWTEVSRWKGSADAAMFSAEGDPGFALLVRGPGRFLWVSCLDSEQGPHDLAGAFCQMLAYWLARLVERGWPLLRPPVAEDELMMAIGIELREGAGPELAVAPEEWRMRLIVGPRLVHALCRGDNGADRALIGAVLSTVGDLPPAAQRQLLDELAPAGRGTIAIWPDPEVRSNPPRFPPAPPVAPRDRRVVEAELAATHVGAEEVAFATGEGLRPVLAQLLETLDRLIARRIDALDGGCLGELVVLHEHLLWQATSEALTLPARDAFGEDADHRLGPREISVEAGLALRALIDRVSAAPPSGGRALGQGEAGWLRAAAELMLQLGGAHDALAGEGVGGRVVIGREPGIVVTLDGDLRVAGERMGEQLSAAAPEAMAREYSAWWGDEGEDHGPPALDAPIAIDHPAWEQVDRELLEEWGVGLEQMLRLLRALADWAEGQPAAVLSEPPELVGDRLRELTAIDRSRVDRGIDLLTLGRCQGYDVMDIAHRPWGFNRDRCYLRQPLVLLPDGRLSWSSFHVLRASRHLYGLIEAGRLRGDDDLRRAVRQASQDHDRQFEVLLLERVEELGWEARLRVEVLGGVPLRRSRGEQIGDVDVLAWSAPDRQVWLLDAKRLAPGLEPAAMVREAGSLRKSAAHHLERLQWVRDRRELLAAEIGEGGLSDWGIDAALVLDHPLAGAHLAELGLPIWTLRELPSVLSPPDG
jgi:hypothetical protein